MKKTFYLFIALCSTLMLSAKTIYLNTGGQELWGKDAPAFFAHSWGAQDSDVQLSLVSGDVFKGDIPDGNSNILFVRMPGGSTAINWDTRWNKTGDLTIPADMDCYTITGWGDNDGQWSKYDSSNPGTNPGTDPNPNPGGDGNPRYYWKGNVDGSDVEPSDLTQFVNGQADIAFSSVAYIFVLYQVDNYDGVQYMTSALVDATHTHATLSVDGGGKYEKWQVPAGTTKLYLYDNGDGSLEISSEPMTGKTPAIPGGNAQSSVEQITINEDAPMYNLLGVRVDKEYKGIVIQGGRKFVRQ